MKNKTLSLITAVLITMVVILVIGIYAAVVLSTPMNLLLKILIGMILLFLLGVSVYVLIDRIKEIRSGKYDDISKYWFRNWP